MKTCKLFLLLWLLPLVSIAQTDTSRRLIIGAPRPENPSVVGDDKGPVRPLSSYTTAPVVALDNFNNYGVVNNPLASTTFTLTTSCLLVSIQTYHWNYGKGKVPGNIKILHANGTAYGPWTAKGTPGSGGVANVFWTVYPNVSIPAGTYTVVDSDKATWSCNTQSLKKGFTKVMVKK